MAKNWISDDQKRLIQSSINREQLLDILGSKHIKFTNNQIRCTCPIHGGDNPTAFALFPDNNWACFTKHCNENQRQDLFSLVMKVKRISFMEAAKFLAYIGGVNISFSDASDPELMASVQNDSWARHTQGKNLYQKDPNKIQIEDYIVRRFIQQRNNYMIERGFTNDTLNVFEIGYCKDWIGFVAPEISDRFPVEDRITFPICWDGRYVGIQGRCTRGKGKERDYPNDHWPRDKKYDNIRDFVKSNFIYNYERAIRYANMTRKIIICEGITDVMMLYQYGIRNAVCVFGSSVDADQIKLLCKGLWDIYIFFDNDEAGIKGTEVFFENGKDLFNIYRVLPPEGKDPASLQPEVVYDLICRAQLLTA